MEEPKATREAPAPSAMQRLLDAPKGHLDYSPGEAFMLHVFWEAPSAAAAHQLLTALQACARATHRDTPCTPLYFFRVSRTNSDLCTPAPRTIAEHPQLRAALKKVQAGIPLPAVRADLTRRGLDPKLLELDPEAPLPAELCAQPTAVEFTEIYLDERAFMMHAGSKDYLEAYGQVRQLL
jgi:hypothetical protein